MDFVYCNRRGPGLKAGRRRSLSGQACLAAMLICSAALVLSSCKGAKHSVASSSAGSNTIASAAANVATIAVTSGPGGTAVINKLYTTVTICAPGSTTNCQTIDHIQVDTGATGMRVFAEVLAPALASALPLQVDANGNNIVECSQYAGGYEWGPVATADLHISGETAASLPIQVIGSSLFPTAPGACAGSGIAKDTVAAAGASGSIGVSTRTQDCGSACALSLDPAINPGFYYACSSSTICNVTTVPLLPASGPTQVANPVTLFAKDNNGVIIELPSVGATGSTAVTGAMVFGIDTQTNNASSTATTILTIDPVSGYLSTTFNTTGYPGAYFDTGSSGIFFDAATLTALSACTDAANSAYYCPSSTQNYSATVMSTANIPVNVTFSVASADTLTAGGTTLVAFSNLAGRNPVAGSFVWGLPFYFGRNIYSVIEGKTTTYANGPYIAF